MPFFADDHEVALTSPPRANGGATSQSAARILILLDKLGDIPTNADDAIMPGCVRVIRAQSRLAKLDFWLRNPDYLADELLTDLEAGLLTDDLVLPLVHSMLEGTAPKLHIYPMQRYRFGAWEIPDNALAVLKFYGMVDHRRAAEMDASNAGKARRDYYLLPPGIATLTKIRSTVDQIDWYDQQADAIALLEASTTGAAARKRQYEQPEYASTPIGADIGSILGRTRERFDAMAADFCWTPDTAKAGA